MSPLEQVVDSKNANSELLDILLSIPEICSPPDMSFENAVENGLFEFVEKFLEIESVRKLFVTTEYIMKLLNKISPGPVQDAQSDAVLEVQSDAILEAQSRELQIRVVDSLIKMVEKRGVINQEIVEKIIELNLIEIWASIPEKAELETGHLLHFVVYHRNVQFVELFLSKYKNSVVTRATLPQLRRIETDKPCNEYYPLWYNKKKWNGSSWVDNTIGDPQDAQKIRAALVTATIKQVNKMRILSDIFQESAEKVREICFDLSQFSFKNHGVDEFVYSLINHRGNSGLLSYEQTIKYARFPTLEDNVDDQQSSSSRTCIDHTEVFDVLDWLKEQKGVTSIVELKVPDRMFKPHNELKIAEYVKKFEVENLDWRFLDLSLSLFDDEVKGRIKKLHLYSSGKHVAINHWLGSEGIASFPKLSLVHIHLVPEMMARKYLNTNTRHLKQELSKLSEAQEHHLEYDVTHEPWNPTNERQASLEETAQKAFPKLYPFIKSYQHYQPLAAEKKKSYRPTRIAIIDNGIMNVPHASRTQADRKINSKHLDEGLNGWGTDDRMSGADRNDTNLTDPSENHKTLGDRIRGGRSFADDDFQLSPWMFASDPHGTQMANLICAIDPTCELYVAKVTDGRFGITPEWVSRVSS
ncbi:hypothetical protein TrVFT333_006638 [Trichoderma virens FT-333]|nr:hypothetical protein TrVFT333_006638 [Trichoderma virens FT-333]